MRVYKFLSGHFGLKSLYERRLKISTLEDLNDPFELIPYDLSNERHRRAMHEARDALVAHQPFLPRDKPALQRKLRHAGPPASVFEFHS
jgi:hypothetical protein